MGKQQGTMVEARSREPDISPRLNDDLNSETSGISRLNDWCAEVDAALGFPPTGADTAAGALDPSSSPECLDTIENHLLAARMRGTQMDGDICAAKTRIDAELNDLESLLNECTAIQEKLAIGPT